MRQRVFSALDLQTWPFASLLTPFVQKNFHLFHFHTGRPILITPGDQQSETEVIPPAEILTHYCNHLKMTLLRPLRSGAPRSGRCCSCRASPAAASSPSSSSSSSPRRSRPARDTRQKSLSAVCKTVAIYCLLLGLPIVGYPPNRG